VRPIVWRRRPSSALLDAEGSRAIRDDVDRASSVALRLRFGARDTSTEPMRRHDDRA
jgi:hypothetical protein